MIPGVSTSRTRHPPCRRPAHGSWRQPGDPRSVFATFFSGYPLLFKRGTVNRWVMYSDVWWCWRQVRWFSGKKNLGEGNRLHSWRIFIFDGWMNQLQTRLQPFWHRGKVMSTYSTDFFPIFAPFLCVWKWRRPQNCNVERENGHNADNTSGFRGT